MLSLLAISFEPTEPPAGYVTLDLLRRRLDPLDVECIEAELTDLGLVWRTRSRPEHPGGEPGAGSEPAGGGS